MGRSKNRAQYTQSANIWGALLSVKSLLWDGVQKISPGQNKLGQFSAGLAEHEQARLGRSRISTQADECFSRTREWSKKFVQLDQQLREELAQVSKPGEEDNLRRVINRYKQEMRALVYDYPKFTSVLENEEK